MVTRASKLGDAPMEALTLDEVRCFLEVTPCPSCQTGPMIFDAPTGPTFTCQACERTGEIEFSVEYPLPDTIDPAIPHINPTDDPSQLVDLNQWLGLYYLHAEAADEHPTSATEHHNHQLWAAACLAEAIKFYDVDEEFPKPESCWTETSRAALENHPDIFSRSHLVDLRTKLPPLPEWPV
jgi:hypothetical protein